ncbi:MAG: SDR family NAD(P)-dependent oxidoreductase [Aureispira sp.]|nr:SDR family NAD(P)-dependent oxidoreductase [Aureispira sp.]
MNTVIMKDRIVFMTGATSGLGKVAACHIANKGAKLIVLVRNTQKGKQLLVDYKKLYPEGKGAIELVEGNLNSFESIIRACQCIKDKYAHLDMIINNAGIMNFSLTETVDGIEETLQVNLLAPILISHLLFDLLVKSKASKIINTASGLHQGIINFDNLEFKKGFSSFKSYRQSKLGLILLGRLLAKELESDKIKVYSQHPGMVRTELGRSAGWLSKAIFWLMGKSPEKGAQTLIYLAETVDASLVSGEYYANKKVTKITPESYDLNVAQQLLDVVQQYLEPYIKQSSPIFDIKEKPTI